MALDCHSANVTADMSKPDWVASIDWSAPWLGPLHGLGEPAAQRILAGSTTSSALNLQAQASLPQANRPAVEFVVHSAMPANTAYEQFIFDSAQVPTREGLHDFLNGLAWLHFPQTKKRLNQLHVAQIAKTGIAPVRGPTRDALTLFDENAALMRAPDALWSALVAKDWGRVFGELRGLWAQSHLVLFGHALLEKLVFPRKSITAHVYRAHPASDSIANMDAWMAVDLSAEKLAAKPFAHLPVLGVPGWWEANQSSDFYADTNVFRAPNAAIRHLPM